MDNLLVHRSGSLLDMFRFRVSNRDLNMECRDAGRWIRRGIKLSPRALDIRYADVPPVEIPLEFDLTSCRLAKLHLFKVHLEDCFTEQFSYLCTILEDLELRHCVFCFHEINSPTLNNLVMDSCKMYSVFDMGSDEEQFKKQLTITAPRLATLHLDLLGDDFKVSVNEMPSLVKASILMFDHVGVLNYNLGTWKLLGNLFNVTTLELSGFLPMVVLNKEEPVEFPTFKNLRALVLDECDLTDNFRLLVLFLQNSLRLEELTVKRCKLSGLSTRGKEKAEPKITPFQFQKPVDRQRRKFKSNIIYTDRKDDRQLVDVLLNLFGNRMGNSIALKRVV